METVTVAHQNPDHSGVPVASGDGDGPDWFAQLVTVGEVWSLQVQPRDSAFAEDVGVHEPVARSQEEDVGLQATFGDVSTLEEGEWVE